MYNETIHTQYVLMTDENQNEQGSYVPDYDELIQEAPNDEMRAVWIHSKELHENLSKNDLKLEGYAYNSIYMLKMACGHYEIFQHHVRDESELVEWITLMKEEEKNRKCTSCICGA